MAKRIPVYAPTAVGGEIEKLIEMAATDYTGLDNGGTGGSYADTDALLTGLVGRVTGDRALPVVWDGATDGYVHRQPRMYETDRHVMVAKARMGGIGYALSGWPRTPSIRGEMYAPETTTEPGDGPWLEHQFTPTTGSSVGMMVSDLKSIRWEWRPWLTGEFKTSGNVLDQRWWFGIFWYDEGVASPWNTTDPSTDQIFAGFRYDTDDTPADTEWKCITHDGTAGAHQETGSGITLAADRRYDLAIRGTASGVEFYAKSSTQGDWDTPVATHATTIPASSDYGAVGLAGKSLTSASQQSMRVKRIVLSHL